MVTNPAKNFSITHSQVSLRDIVGTRKKKRLFKKAQLIFTATGLPSPTLKNYMIKTTRLTLGQSAKQSTDMFYSLEHPNHIRLLHR